ncbi:uncharacterized protein LOC142558162 [Dermacentor variabilis]|uniref:uncharacterized protein LOC142558162 n=1 Tax=Dermacentor variabilis TaxID=34621 RepID=UPI003F5B80FA
MPFTGQRRVHRFRDHAVAGVNWRPTRFVDEVPDSRVCGLCRMIPKWAVLLPCWHILCQSCQEACSQGNTGQCPFDQEPFQEAECFGTDFPARKANSLKIYCWNDVHGCEFVGTVERVLRHYEHECTFHTVECLRCGEGVLHKDLPTHYAAGCSAGASSAAPEKSFSESTALALHGVNSALEDLKSLLADPSRDQLLSAIQIQMNELMEYARSQETRCAEISRQLGTPEQNVKEDMVPVATANSSTVSHRLPSGRHLAEEASKSSSLSLLSEAALILRKLEHFANLSFEAPKDLRETFQQGGRHGIIVRYEPYDVSVQNLTSTVLSTRSFSEQYQSVIHTLTLENCDPVFLCKTGLGTFAQVTVLHMRDTYFTVAASVEYIDRTPYMIVKIEFHGLLSASRCLPPAWRVEVASEDGCDVTSLSSFDTPCKCIIDKDSLLHFHRGFKISCDYLKKQRFSKAGVMLLSIELFHEESEQSGPSSA